MDRMLTQQEKDNIKNGFNNIIIALEKILVMIDKFEQNQASITKLLETNYSATQLENEFKLQDFLKSKEEFLFIKTKFSNISNVDESITEQYRTFLKNNIASFNPEIDYLQPSIHNGVLSFLRRKDNFSVPSSLNNDDVIRHIFYMPSAHLNFLKHCKDLLSNLIIFEQIKNLKDNIVMIGANGSGKSTFARQLRGHLASNVVILAAQRFLQHQKSDSWPASGDEIAVVQEFQHGTKHEVDFNTFKHMITTDMDSLINALMSQHMDCAIKAYGGKPCFESVLDKTISIWQEVIEHRKIEINRTGLRIYGDNIAPYDFNYLSDGEKAVFYYIGHILLAAESSFIVVDEPENHLHATICNKLWDTLEKVRSDCKFIYLTHNLSFATNRSNCTVLWNKEYRPPYTWDFEVLPDTGIIPEQLIMKIVGSRKNVCFCEGNDNSSIDFKLYSILFPQYTVIPVHGHRDVIDFVNVYNQTASFVTTAVGIIDGDHHLPEQVNKWKEQKIYTLPINEIENILCDDYVLQKAAERFCSEEGAVEKFHELFWQLLDENKEIQATQYVNEYVNNSFVSNFLHEKKDINKLIGELQLITSEQSLRDLYNATLSKIEDFFVKKDYSAALKFVNFKGRLTKELARQTIEDKYVNRVLGLIKKDDKLREYLINKYFSDFNFELRRKG